MSSFDDPLFRVYAISAAAMVLLMGSQSWITVIRMMKVKGGFRSPEDVKKSPFNPNPSPDQIQPVEYVERSRRMHLNHCENIPLFLVIGLLFVIARPPLWAAQLALYGYVITRILHFAAYMTAQLHDVRAAMWTPGSIAILSMAGYVLASAI
ncbi:MAG TPA: MAPEG family protein [Kofleriaceae bacterium]|nr:MAPEG family protein [Kofleriaceae bacterium]